MKTRRIIFGLCFVGFALAGVAAFALTSIENSVNAKVEQVEQITLEQKRIHLIQIRKLQKANPERNFAKAWAKQDYRFIGVYGYAYSVPGVSKDKANNILRNKEVTFIKGTGGGVPPIATPEEIKLRGLAINYAMRYNKLLLKHSK